MDDNQNSSIEVTDDLDRRTPDDGVDEGLVRWCLSLTPAERLRALQDNVNSIIRLRKGMPDGDRED